MASTAVILRLLGAVSVDKYECARDIIPCCFAAGSLCLRLCWQHLPPSEQTRKLDLDRLKEKVVAGANFVISHFFYDVDVFLAFHKVCGTLFIGSINTFSLSFFLSLTLFHSLSVSLFFFSPCIHIYPAKKPSWR